MGCTTDVIYPSPLGEGGKHCQPDFLSAILRDIQHLNLKEICLKKLFYK